MKMLISTTAILATFALPAMTFAQTTAPATTPTTNGRAMEMPGFLAAREQTDVFASELMGHDVYARRASTDLNTGDGTVSTPAGGNRTLPMMNRGDLDGMDNIGQINEIVLSDDGQVRALVIGVGGFLGMGEQDAAVTMDQITFAIDPDNRDEMYIVVNTGADMLKTSPKYQRMAMTGDVAGRTAAPTAADRTPFTAPEMAREGYNRVAVTEVSSEMLMGKSVYSIDDQSVGTVEDLTLDDSGAISNLIVDFGGFLGIGTSQVAIGFDEVTILTNAGNDDVRVYVDATKEQVQAQPLYVPVN